MPEILERRRRGQMQVGWGRSPDQAPVAGRQERRPLVRGGRGGWHQADGTTHKREGEREDFSQTISLNSQCLFSERYHPFRKKK